MFEAALEADLKKILDIKKVKFESLDLESEQEVIICDIDRVKYGKQGKDMTCRVSGRIGIKSDKARITNGFIHKRFALNPDGKSLRFWISANEENEKFTKLNNYFTKYTVEFIYWWKTEYNPPKGLMAQIVDWIFNLT